jgi:hypothetical protein
VKTLRIKGKQASPLDVLLLTALELQQSTWTEVWNESRI